MGWEDGTLSNVESLLEAADSVSSDTRKRELLIQAVGSAKLLKDDYKRQNYVRLIEDKLQDLD